MRVLARDGFDLVHEDSPVVERILLVGYWTKVIEQPALPRLKPFAVLASDDDRPREIAFGPFGTRAHTALVRVVLQRRAFPLSCSLDFSHGWPCFLVVCLACIPERLPAARIRSRDLPSCIRTSWPRWR